MRLGHRFVRYPIPALLRCPEVSPQDSTPLAFSQLALSARILAALDEVGYETPTAIQAEVIPVFLSGRDLIGQAQTGTGKTAAFALPLLSTIDITRKAPQALVLTPTRELAIQVAEAFQRYASHIPGFHVLPVYGGQEYGVQLRALKRGVHVVVGTPGRVMDHMRRETLPLDALRYLVLDEADEMLRMGFIDDVEWVLEQIPGPHQTALFSATMPRPIRKIAERYLREPEEISVRLKTVTAATVRQRYWMVSGLHKLDALTRILEVENFQSVLIFVRTKTATLELAERLEARGFASGAINGDMPQKTRERTIDQLKKGKLDILVATDVAARGLDVERISHVINYDVPYDPEAYVHRIGRTGRAGRHGDAILFVAPREARMLRLIERSTRHPIERMELPSAETINDSRRARFMQAITDTLTNEDLEPYAEVVMRYQREHDTDPLVIAAALARLLQGDEPLLLQAIPKQSERARREREEQGPRRVSPEQRSTRSPDRRVRRTERVAGMEVYRIEVGRTHGVQPSNIVGAVANEAGLDAREIGRIDIFDDHSTVELPEGMPREIFNHLKRVWVSGQRLRISRSRETPGKASLRTRDDPAGVKLRSEKRHRVQKSKGTRKS
jgi:ATP-dependent RNA helicase DeaD